MGIGFFSDYSFGLQMQWVLFLFQKEDVIRAEVDERLSLRKHRFMHFASLEYEGEYYMTPRDFLFSVMFDQVERKLLPCQYICEGKETCWSPYRCHLQMTGIRSFMLHKSAETSL